MFHNCRLKAVSREKVLLNFNGTVLHPANNIIVHVKLFKKANGFKPWLLDVKLDACRFVRTNFHPFVRIIFDLFKDFSTINHTCPYVVSILKLITQHLIWYHNIALPQGLQVVKDFYLRPEKLKLPFPSGDYLLSLIWIFDKRPQFDTNVSFVYAEDLINA